LNSDELEGTDVIVIVFQAKFNDFAHAFHQGVEFLGLGVATASHVFPKHPDGRRAGTVPT
jgi:hypothetical protein